MLSTSLYPLASLVYLAGVLSSPTPAGGLQPATISLKSRKLTDNSKLRRRALSPASTPLLDYFNGTDLQWFGTIEVGTPPQEFTVVFDTGSFSLEIPGTSCTTCINQRKFDGSKSSTFVDNRRSSSITFGTGVGVDPVIGNNWQLTLDSVQDTVSVAGLTASNIQFFQITRQTAPFDPDPFDGIMGVGASAGSFFQSLVNQGLPSMFSLFLTPNSVGGAELTLGGIDRSKLNGAMTFVPTVGRSSLWQLSSTAISVNGKTTSTLATTRSIVFDSGTSNLVFPQATTEAIYALISPNIKANAAEAGTYGIPCNQIATLPAVIDFTFTSTTGAPFNLTIPSSELSVGPFRSNPSLCQTLINAQGISIIGGSLLKHYYSNWDVGNARIGFSKNSF